jgi:hypothetical protein
MFQQVSCQDTKDRHKNWRNMYLSSPLVNKTKELFHCFNKDKGYSRGMRRTDSPASSAMRSPHRRPYVTNHPGDILRASTKNPRAFCRWIVKRGLHGCRDSHGLSIIRFGVWARKLHLGSITDLDSVLSGLTRSSREDVFTRSYHCHAVNTKVEKVSLIRGSGGKGWNVIIHFGKMIDSAVFVFSRQFWQCRTESMEVSFVTSWKVVNVTNGWIPLFSTNTVLDPSSSLNESYWTHCGSCHKWG